MVTHYKAAKVKGQKLGKNTLYDCSVGSMLRLYFNITTPPHTKAIISGSTLLSVKKDDCIAMTAKQPLRGWRFLKRGEPPFREGGLLKYPLS